jgi:hypothetical protein
LNEAKGHRILLRSDDLHFKISALVDGTTVDFLFGVASTNRKNNPLTLDLKSYIIGLDERKQADIILFYTEVYEAVIDYLEKVDGYGILSCCCIPVAQKQLRNKIETAFFNSISSPL